MVVELVLTTLVTQAVNHYAGRGFVWFDQRVTEVAEKAAAGDAQARHEVAAQLAARLRELPRSEADDVAVASPDTREGMVTEILFDPPPRAPGWDLDLHAEPLSPRMEKFMATLDGTFRAVHAFPHSITVAPGWFHTDLCVTVLDCRARNGTWHPEVPVRWPGGGAGPYFVFEDVDGRPGSLTIASLALSGRPRVTVVECADLDEREEVLERLRPVVTDLHNEHQHWGKPLLAEVAGVDPTQVRALLRLHEDRVELGGPASDVREEGEDVQDYMDRPKWGPAVVELDSPVGMRDLKADLVRQLLVEADRDAEWLDF